jgi:GTPase SAR1 family protein
VIVGNKMDLASERQVAYAQGQGLADACNHAPFFEASASTDTNVTQAIHQLIRVTPRTSCDYKGMTTEGGKREREGEESMISLTVSHPLTFLLSCSFSISSRVVVVVGGGGVGKSAITVRFVQGRQSMRKA